MGYRTYCLWCLPMKRVLEVFYGVDGCQNQLVDLEKHPDCRKRSLAVAVRE